MAEQYTFTRSCCISAGAGAGKTTCLVGAYLDLLAQGYNPRQIVVITFTEKAAAELGQRIQDAVGENLALEQLQWAPISTIHSFCASLLREQAGLCGLDPAFSILDAAQFERLLEQTLNRLLRVWLKSQNRDLEALLKQYEYSQLAPFLAKLLKASYINNLAPDDIKRSTLQAIKGKSRDADNMAILARQQAVALWPRLTRQVLDTENAVRQAEELYAAKQTKKAQNELQKAQKQETAARLLVAQYQFMLANWENGPEQAHAALALAANKDSELLLNALQEWAMALKLEQARELSVHFLNLFAQLYQEVEHELARTGALSFDHLIIKANALFNGHTAFAKEFHARFPIIMVDEFQDVNPLQAQLVRHMAGQTDNEHGHIQHITSRLLVVGDRKQSIYGFRGADVAVFSRLKDAFAQYPHADSCALGNNYRSPKELVDFFNYLFAEMVFSGQGERQAYEVSYLPEYDDQKPGREHDYKGRIEIIDCNEPDIIASREVLRNREAQAIACHIKTIIANQEAVPGDIVLLFRSLGRVELYAQALRQHNIPCYVDRGGNFYQQSEVIDLALGLGSLEQAPQALVGALLSPIFALDLQALLAGLDKNGTVVNEPPAGLDRQRHGLWQKALAFYNTYSKLAHSMQPVELISALLEDTGWQLQLAARPGGAQQLANLRKLLETSRQAPMVHNPLDYLMNELKRAEREPLAPLLSGQANVVRLMTIHQAKGLEFPVVILPDLVAAEPRNQPPEFFLLSQQGVMALNLGIKFARQNATTYNALFAELLNEHKAREAAESARIFYVAATRARQRLVFGYFRGPRNKSQWSAWVEQLISGKEHNIAICRYSDFASHERHYLPEQIGPAELREQMAIVKHNCQKITFTQRLVSTSVSNLEEWLACPRRGWLRQNMGIDWAQFPHRAGPVFGRSETIPELAAWQQGNLIHKILELAEFDKPFNEVYAIISGLNLKNEHKQYLQDLLSPLWSASLPKEIAQYEHVRHEEPFVMYLHNDNIIMEISGELDLLAFSQQRVPLLVDYKVSIPKPQQYETQMKCYSLACFLENGIIPQTVLCFLFDGKCQLNRHQYSVAELNEFKQQLLNTGQAMLDTQSLGDLLPPNECDSKCQLNAWCKG